MGCFFHLLGMCRVFVSIYAFLLPYYCLQIISVFLCPSFLISFSSSPLTVLSEAVPSLFPCFFMSWCWEHTDMRHWAPQSGKMFYWHWPEESWLVCVVCVVLGQHLVLREGEMEPLESWIIGTGPCQLWAKAHSLILLFVASAQEVNCSWKTILHCELPNFFAVAGQCEMWWSYVSRILQTYPKCLFVFLFFSLSWVSLLVNLTFNLIYWITFVCIRVLRCLGVKNWESLYLPCKISSFTGLTHYPFMSLRKLICL